MRKILPIVLVIYANVSFTACHQGGDQAIFADFTLVRNFEKFLSRKEGMSIDANRVSLFSELPVFLFIRTSDSSFYLSENFGQDSLRNVMTEVWRQRYVLTVVCDPNASIRDRELYYRLYELLLEEGQTVIAETAFAQYGMPLSALNAQQRLSLGYNGVPFVLYIASPMPLDYEDWIENFASVENLKKRGIPISLFEP